MNTRTGLRLLLLLVLLLSILLLFVLLLQSIHLHPHEKANSRLRSSWAEAIPQLTVASAHL